MHIMYGSNEQKQWQVLDKESKHDSITFTPGLVRHALACILYQTHGVSLLSRYFQVQLKSRVQCCRNDRTDQVQLLTKCSVGLQSVEVEPMVDFDLLAEKTAGYSGDDITGVCRDAAMNGMRRKIMGKTPEQIRSVTGHQQTHDACQCM